MFLIFVDFIINFNITFNQKKYLYSINVLINKQIVNQ